MKYKIGKKKGSKTWKQLPGSDKSPLEKERSNKKGKQEWDMVIHHCSTLIGPHLTGAPQHPEMSESLLC